MKRRDFLALLASLPAGGALAAAERTAGGNDGAPEGHTIVVEAERFTDFGGWVNDAQFMDQMGSPFLLAHGMGKPVADATVDVKVPASGLYNVYAYKIGRAHV